MAIKQLVSIALASLTALTALSGCSGSKGSGSASSGSSVKGALTVCTWDFSKTQYLKDTQTAYQKLHPDVTLKFLDITASDYINKVTVMLAGGDASDVIDFKTIAQEDTLVSQGRIEKMDPYISKTKFDMKAYEGMEKDTRIDNVTYVLPYRYDFWVLFYNKDLFDKAKVSYPTNDMTWDDYRALAKKMTSGSGSSKIYGTYTHTWQSSTQDWSVAEGNGPLTNGKYDSLKSYYDVFLNLQKDGSVMDYSTVKAAGGNYTGYWANQNIAMIIMGTWLPANVLGLTSSGNYSTFNWGMVNVPHSKGLQSGSTIGNVTSCGINANSKNKDLAWNFIQWRCGEDGALVHAKDACMPAVRTDKVLKAYTSVKGMPTDSNSQQALKPAKVSIDVPVDAHATEITNILTEENELIMTGSETVDKGIANMNSRVAQVKAGK